MDYGKYRDIAPYRGEDFQDALGRFLSSRDSIDKFFSSLFLPGDPRKDVFIDALPMLARDIHDYQDFQKKVTSGVLIPTVVKRTIEEFTSTGGEELEKGKSYLFISTHRDIILDCALVDYAMLGMGHPLVEMAFGDNLITSKFVEDLFRLNGGILVKRELPIREKYTETVRLSEYIVESITEGGTSVWVAQKSGRSKDGIDETHPAIIKMLYVSQKKKGISFSDLIKNMHIVPVSISYQYNPNDVMMSREEVGKIEKGQYEKKKYEDAVSMMKGIKENKGKTHLSFGRMLDGDYQTPEEVARAIDKEIHTSYKLWDTNYFAYDYLEGTKRFEKEYEDLDVDKFLLRFKHSSESVRNYALSSYANPVRKYLEEVEA